MNERGSSRTHIFAAPPGDAAAGPARNDDGSAGSHGFSHAEDQATVISKRPATSAPAFAASANPMQLGKMLEGAQLGHYHLEEFVGGGGMGAVFRANDTMLNRVVAVKVLSQDHAGDNETVRRFKNEAQSAARLDHENIGRVYYVGEDRGLYYIVFEFIEGVNLRDLVESRGPLPLDEAFSYTLQVTTALDHASRRDVVHRDIKPSNVLITPLGKAKLVDMGLARLHQVEHSQNDLTASGVTLGTFDYISPEQARDPRSADVRSDLYSLGCTLYYMLTGRPPFPEGTVLQKLLQHQGEDPPSPVQFRPDLPEGVVQVLLKLLAKSPDKRFQRPRELINELATLATNLGMHVAAGSETAIEPPAPRAPSLLRRQLPWLIPLATLVLIAATLHLLWSSTPASSASDDTLLPPIVPAVVVASTVPPADASPALSTKPGTANAGSPSIERTTTAPGGSTAEIDRASDELARISMSAQEKYDLLRTSAAEVEQWAGSLAGGVWQSFAAIDVGAAGSGRAVGSTLRHKFFVISSAGLNRGFGSLREACAAAESGDKIELAFTGRSDERPIEIANRNLTLRAAGGFQPVLYFKPDHVDPVKYARNVVRVSGGELSLQGVHVMLDIPREMAAEGRSLFQTESAEGVRLEGCTLTIRNLAAATTEMAPDVAFFEIKAPPGGDAMMMEDAAMPRKITELQLKNCIVRGEAVVLRLPEMQPLRFVADNSFITTPDRLLYAAGSESNLRGGAPIHLELRRVTASVGGGLCRIVASEDAPYQLPLEVRCTESILIGDPANPMIDQVGFEPADDLRRRVSWMGDQNFYEGFRTFWRAQGPGASVDPLVLSFSQWREHWGTGRESLPSSGVITFEQLPDADRPAHLQSLADYAFSERAENPPQKVGTQPDVLPAVPDEGRMPPRASETRAGGLTP